MRLVNSGEKPEPKHFLRFFYDLKKEGQIDASNFELVLEKLIAEKLISEDDLYHHRESLSEKKVFQHQGDRLFTFLDLCLKHHMREKAVFSCFFEDSTSKYFDKRFMDHIIVNPLSEV